MVMLVAMGGGALLPLGFEKKGGAAEVYEDGVVATSGGGGRFALPNKESTHDLSHDAAFDACR